MLSVLYGVQDGYHNGPSDLWHQPQPTAAPPPSVMVPRPKIFMPIRSQRSLPIRGISSFTPSPTLPTMPKVIVSFKNDISDADMDKAISNIKACGGVVKDDYRPLMKAIAADIPENYVSTLTDDGSIKNIELDGIVTTQGT